MQDRPTEVPGKIGAEGETRTLTGFLPPPPQDGVSTDSTTSAFAPMPLAEGSAKHARSLRLQRRPSYYRLRADFSMCCHHHQMLAGAPHPLSPLGARGYNGPLGPMAQTHS